MVCQVIAVVESSNRPDRRESQKIDPEIITLDVREHAPVHSVVADDENGIVTIADYRNREQDRPPRRMDRYHTESSKNPSPANSQVGQGAQWPKLAQFLDSGRREQYAAVRKVRSPLYCGSP